MKVINLSTIKFCPQFAHNLSTFIYTHYTTSYYTYIYLWTKRQNKIYISNKISNNKKIKCSCIHKNFCPHVHNVSKVSATNILSVDKPISTICPQTLEMTHQKYEWSVFFNFCLFVHKLREG